MNTLSKIPYLLREGLHNLWSNRLMSVSSIGVLGVCLLLISNAVLISNNINGMISQIGNEDAIVVYLQDGTSAEDAEAFGGELLKIENVEAVEYISSKAALDSWKEILSEYPDILEGIDEDFLPASYSITVIDLEKVDETLKQLESMEEISSIREMTELRDQLIGIRRAVSAALYGIVVVLFAVSLFIIANTIKLAMYSRRKEISIMKYVGGTDWFIRIPFVVEGFFIGLIAALLAFFVQWYVYQYVITQLVTSINFVTPIAFGSFSGTLLLSLCAGGALVGMAGSLVSIRKYLRV